MSLWQVDTLKRYPYEHNPSGWYYWTNVYYYNADTLIEAKDHAGSIQNSEVPVLSHDTQCGPYQLHNPPGRGNIIAGRTNFWEFGTTLIPGGGLLLSHLRVNLYWADGSWGYKRWRVPLPPSLQAGGLADAGFVAQLETMFSFPLNGITLRSHLGSPLVRASVDPRLRQWQLRHGSKRANRPVFATEAP